jgi:hypothetical protein
LLPANKVDNNQFSVNSRLAVLNCVNNNNNDNNITKDIWWLDSGRTDKAPLGSSGVADEKQKEIHQSHAVAVAPANEFTLALYVYGDASGILHSLLVRSDDGNMFELEKEVGKPLLSGYVLDEGVPRDSIVWELPGLYQRNSF